MMIVLVWRGQGYETGPIQVALFAINDGEAAAL